MYAMKTAEVTNESEPLRNSQLEQEVPFTTSSRLELNDALDYLTGTTLTDRVLRFMDRYNLTLHR
jgi:hypothetical protein